VRRNRYICGVTHGELNVLDRFWLSFRLDAPRCARAGRCCHGRRQCCPNDKLATYGVDDPEVEGVACHFTVPERGGFKGWLGLAEEVSDISLACRQIGPIKFKNKSDQGEDMFRLRRSLFFKKMQIVRGCDAKRNVLVYMVYSDRIIEGSPKNSTSSVPIMPWGQTNADVQKCGDFIK
jgi:CreA protein